MDELKRYYIDIIRINDPENVNAIENRLKNYSESNQLLPLFIDKFFNQFNKGTVLEYSSAKSVLKGMVILSNEQFFESTQYKFMSDEFIISYSHYYYILVNGIIVDNKLCECLIELALNVFPKIEFNIIPKELIQINFKQIEYATLFLPVFEMISKVMNPKVLQELYVSRSMKEALNKTVETMLDAKLNENTLKVIDTYLNFIKTTCTFDSRILNIHIQSLFFNRIVIIITSPITFEMLNTSVNDTSFFDTLQLSIVTSLQDLCFYGNGVYSITSSPPSFNNYNNVGLIKNYEIPSILMKLLVCPRLTLYALQSIQFILFCNPENYYILPTYLESICLMLVSFKSIEIELVFQMLEKLLNTYHRDLSPFVDVFIQFISLSNFLHTSIMPPFISFIIKLIGSHRSLYQSSLSPLLIPLVQVLLDTSTTTEDTSNIVECVTRVICILLSGNKENTALFMRESSIIEKLVQLFNNKPQYRNEITSIIKEVIALVPTDQAALISTLMIDEILNDIDPISRLSSAISLMDQSPIAREMFGVCNCFELLRKFIERWGYSQPLNTPTRSKTLVQRMNIITSCVDSYVCTLQESTTNRMRLQNGFPVKFVDDYLEFNPWKETEPIIVSSHILALITEQPTNKIKSIFIGEPIKVNIINSYLLPSLLRFSKSLEEKHRNYLFKTLTNSFESTMELFGAYQSNVLETILFCFSNALNDPLLVQLIEKIGRYSIKPKSCKKLIKALKGECLNSNLLSILSSMVSGDTVGGLTFDTSDKVSYIKNYIWLDNIPLLITGWFRLCGGIYNIVEIIPVGSSGGISISINTGIMEISNDNTRLSFINVPLGTWFHLTICLYPNQPILCFVNGNFINESKSNINILQGSYTVTVGHNGHSIHSYSFSVGELMIINGTRTTNDIKTMYQLGPQYKGRYCASCYNESISLRGPSSIINPSISIQRDDIIYVMTDLINDVSRTDLVVEGRVCPTSPSPFVTCICRCGGIALLLSLIEKSSSTPELCDSLQVLMFCLRGSSELYAEAIKTNSFDILVFILHSKKQLISHGVLQVLLALSGIKTSDSDFCVTHPEILTTLVLDFDLLSSCPNGIEYVLKTLKSVYEFSPVSASESLRGVGLMRKLMVLFIDENTESSVINCVTQLLICILSVNCSKEEVSVVTSFASYFLQVFDKSDSDIHRSWCAFRCTQLLTLLDQIVSVKGILPGLSSNFIYQFVSVSKPPESLAPPLLHLAANLSFLSQSFSDDFYADLDQLLRVVYVFTSSKESIYALFALLLHTNPVISELFTTVNIVQRPLCPRYMLLLNEIVRLSLLIEFDKQRILNSEFIILTFIDIFHQYRSIRQSVIQSNELVKSLLNVLVLRNKKYIGDAQLNKEQQTLCKDVVKCIGYLIAASLRDGDGYKKIIYYSSILQPNGDLLKEIILSSIQQLHELFYSIPKDKITKIFVEYSQFLLDISISQQMNISLHLVINCIYVLMNIYIDFKEIHSKDQNNIWVEMIDRMNLLMFDNITEDSFVFAAQQFHLQDFFFSQPHSEIYVTTFLTIILTQITNSQLKKINPIYSSILKRISMSYMNVLNKILPNRDLKKGFKSLLQMNSDKVFLWIENKIVELRSLCLQLNQSIRTFRNTQEERKEIIVKQLAVAFKEIGNEIDDIHKSVITQDDRLKEIDNRRQRAIELYIKERKYLYDKPLSIKLQLITIWNKMKLKLIMPKGIWEEDVEEYMIDDIQSSFGIRRRIVRDYRFKERYESQIGEYGKIIKLPIIQKNYDIEVLTTPFGEEEEIYYCTQLYGLEEVESQIKIDEKKFILINYINTDHCDWIKIDWNDIVCIIKRRYLLQNNAIEILTCYGKSLFLIFEHKYDKIIKKFMKYKSESFDIIHEIEPPINLINKIGKVFNQIDEMTELWKKGELSNFNYLMYLNTKAGRSFNDLSQYPIFPWILNDYTSKTIDLNDEHIYRNFAYPIVAQTENKREKLQIKFPSSIEYILLF
ncbi:hypothetical protein conserved domain containing [Entamoeba histolytica]|uniref:Beige/BEACH domain containing protein n=1 Tax=Entamoeba histolytica TaxID=5759 RepID=A0A175JQQ7_ENTHI|nr:hypothetical protein conserved domain containing [Entamoeba histolytica]